MDLKKIFISYVSFLTKAKQTSDNDTSLIVWPSPESSPDKPIPELSRIKFIIPSRNLNPVEVYLENNRAEYVAEVIKNLQEKQNNNGFITDFKEKINLLFAFF